MRVLSRPGFKLRALGFVGWALGIAGWAWGLVWHDGLDTRWLRKIEANVSLLKGLGLYTMNVVFHSGARWNNSMRMIPPAKVAQHSESLIPFD